MINLSVKSLDGITKAYTVDEEVSKILVLYFIINHLEMYVMMSLINYDNFVNIKLSYHFIKTNFTS